MKETSQASQNQDIAAPQSDSKLIERATHTSINLREKILELYPDLADYPSKLKCLLRQPAETGVQPDDDVKGIIEQDLNAMEHERKALDRILMNPISARVNPKQKLQLVSMHQQTGEIVAMTGDGVNDAPALKKADVGIAMGMRGTQVARETADLVLKDDSFSTIVTAVKNGRVIFDNIRKFVLYLLSCNVSEILVVSLAALVNAPLPIRPLQILYLNLVTDVFPAFALGVGRGDESVMKNPPRDPQEPILAPEHLWAIGGYSALICLSTLAAFAISLNLLQTSPEGAVSISFLTLAMAQLWHVFNMRSRRSSFQRNEITRNPYIWGAIGLCLLLLLAAVYLPGLGQLLGIVDPRSSGWLVAFCMSLLPVVFGQILNHE
jgi:Ca2+-transporting ATPase